MTPHDEASWKKTRFAAVAGIVLILGAVSRHFVVDDGLIYARFVRNALAGNGFVFNTGERINSLTSPLFSYLLFAVSWLLHGNILLAEHLLFALAFLAACWLAETIAPWSGVFVASTAYFYTLIGLESSLFLLMILLVAKAYDEGRDDWLPVLLVLVTLTRFEGGLFIPIVGWHLWRQRRLPRLVSFLPAILLVVLYLALNYHWYGGILPHSASSKFGQARSQYWGKWPMGFLRPDGWAVRTKSSFFFWTMYIVPLTVWFSFRGWRLMRTQPVSQILGPFWLGLLAFYVLSNMPAYHWYYAPIIFIPMIYAVIGIPASRTSSIALATILVVSGVTNFWYLATWAPKPVREYIEVAQWLNRNSAPDATVETVELGHIGWYTNRHVNDVLGLTLPKNADHIAHRDCSSWLAEDKPDYIVMHDPALTFEEVATRDPNYQRVVFRSGSVYVLQRDVVSGVSGKTPRQ